MAKQNNVMKIIAVGGGLVITILVTALVISAISDANEQAKIKEDNASTKQLQQDAKENMDSWVNEKNHTECLDEAHDNYKSQWDSEADANGQLPQDSATFLDSRYESAKEDCDRLYN